MSDFDYGNARLHAMKSRLLPAESLESLAANDSVMSLLNALTKTDYRVAVERAFVQFTGMPAFNEAMRLNLVDTVQRIKGFFPGKAADYVTWMTRRYDVDNIKTILRGVAHNLPADEIVNSTLPIADLTSAELNTLARASHPAAVIDLLATWRMPLAQPILSLQTDRKGAPLFEMELALEQWYFQAVMAVNGGKGQSLKQTMMRQADITNIMTALRLVGVGEAEMFLQAYLTTKSAVPLFVGPGYISHSTLAEAVQASSIEKAVALLSRPPYDGALATGLAHYNASRRLTEFERALTQAQRQQTKRFFISDPHGIGVLIGYLFLKTAEIANLRRIAHGIRLGQPPEQIRGGFL